MKRHPRPRSWHCIAAALLALAGIAAAPSASAGDAPASAAAPLRVLLMPLDVELGELTGTGVYKVRADWTQRARTMVAEAIGAQITAPGRVLVAYPTTGGPEDLQPAHVQPVKLHAALEQTLLRYVYGPGASRSKPALLTKKHDHDWTLGNALAPLQADTDADQVLFVHLRDRSPTAGRTAMDVAALVLFGALSPSGQQSGFASLLDLRSGALLWSNVSVRAFGDLRSPEGARAAVSALLDKLPR